MIKTALKILITIKPFLPKRIISTGGKTMKRGWHATIIDFNSKHQQYMIWTHLTWCSRSDLCLKVWIVLLQNRPRGSIITSISQTFCSVLSYRALKFLWCCQNSRQMSSTLFRQNGISVGHSQRTGFILSFKTMQELTIKWPTKGWCHVADGNEYGCLSLPVQ